MFVRVHRKTHVGSVGGFVRTSGYAVSPKKGFVSTRRIIMTPRVTREGD